VDVVGDVVTGLLPTLGVTLLFAVAIWAIVRADAAERTGRARVEADEDAADRAARGMDGPNGFGKGGFGKGGVGKDPTGVDETRPPE